MECGESETLQALLQPMPGQPMVLPAWWVIRVPPRPCSLDFTVEVRATLEGNRRIAGITTVRNIGPPEIGGRPRVKIDLALASRVN